MTSGRTLESLLAPTHGEAVAISSPDAKPLTYDGLKALVAKTIAVLNGFGVGRGDRVATVLPNGPEMATAFIAIASGAVSAPLNPGYRADEFEFYMGDLGAKALVVEAGSASPAVDAAKKLGHRGSDPDARRERESGKLHALWRTARLRRAAGLRQPRGHRADPAHLGDDLSAQNRASVATQRRDFGQTMSRGRWSSRKPIAA